jgi:lactoylglutathione lyase
MSRTTTTIAHIGTISLYVDDQDGALDFWTRQVGFEKRRDAPMGEGGRWIEVAPPGEATALVIYPKAGMEDWAEHQPSIVFRCADAELAYRTLSDNGVQFEGPPQRTEWGTFAAFLDTEGNKFGLSS